MNGKSFPEAEADKAIAAALAAIDRALFLSREAEYGSLVISSVADAKRDVSYALATVKGEN